jgi:mono/diheme cytochrome c family protein
MSPRLFLVVALASLTASGCTDPEPMVDQRRYRPWGENAFFEDGRSMRPLPAHVVPREAPAGAEALLTGRTDGQYVTELPFPVDRALLEHGRNRFEVYCATCHGVLGDGDSLVAQNMPLRPPPSLLVHEAHGSSVATGEGDHVHLSTGHVFEVISQGYGFMPSYANELRVEERWAVVAYLEALRLSQTARVAELPAHLRAHFDGGVR